MLNKESKLMRAIKLELSLYKEWLRWDKNRKKYDLFQH